MAKREIVAQIPEELHGEILNAMEHGERKEDTIQRLIQRGVDSLSLPPVLTLATVVSAIIWIGSLAFGSETVSMLIGGFYIAFVGFWISWRVIARGLDTPEQLRA